MRFRDRNKEFTLEHFISGSEDSIKIFLLDDIIVDFEKGKYIGSYCLPF
ncbi:hypothetical protein [Clostridium cibarium]|uniref:Uncharacterized protein n=1 Tax=Clostridium cibarium TaxID=2762247 RepID=A0ABR8PV68_9CLOT|nr:hypothetical protein [Clostridium cibarium]MBD7912063.1 hypothetical protein [Clostridium cibarium]